jgi:hypothetical protein
MVIAELVYNSLEETYGFEESVHYALEDGLRKVEIEDDGLTFKTGGKLKILIVYED